MSNGYAGRAGGSLKSSLGPSAPNFPSPGIGSMGAYMIGARPFMARFRCHDPDDTPNGKVFKVTFPGVTRKIIVKVISVSGGVVKYAFHPLTIVQFSTADSAMDAGAEDAQPFFSSTAGTSIDLGVRATELYIHVAQNQNAVIEILAEITSINSADMPAWSSFTNADAGTPTTKLEGVQLVSNGVSLSAV